MKFSSLAALEVVILTTSSAAIDGNCSQNVISVSKMIICNAACDENFFKRTFRFSENTIVKMIFVILEKH